MLQISNLVVKYGHAEALHGISLNVPKGKIVALLGVNGAGKTTTLQAISNLQSVFPGSSIKFKDKEITAMKTHSIIAEGISYVLEGRQIFGKLSVDENLKMGAFLRKDKSEIVRDINFCFDLFPRLKERHTQLGGTLSGGEQQMLAIARGLMSKPEFLMLDEPSMGLAPVVVGKIYETIIEINKTGVTILLVEQNANIALEVCNYAYTLTNGNISNAGTSVELLKNDKFISAFLGENNEV
jgi:branched-chain amino acid transport system ATP-binding protein